MRRAASSFGLWWFWLAQVFGGSPIQWVISVGMFSGCIVGYWLLYRMERERSAWKTTGQPWPPPKESASQ